MEQFVSRATIINLEHLPVYEVPDTKRGLPSHIARYLKTFFSKNSFHKGNYLELPSLSVLSRFFRSTHLELYDAFKALRTYGYDYQFSSLDGSVTVWKTSRYGDTQ